jgi:deoxyribodipyrimidine photo-lyase
VGRGIVLFTRDLRVHDYPALAAAAAACTEVVPLFVLDDRLLRRHSARGRGRFLLESLADLDTSLRELGACLVVRRGDPVAEVLRVASEVAAERLFLSEDVSRFGKRRESALRHACAPERIDVVACPGVTVAPLGAIVPAGSDHYRVFTPYWRRWSSTPVHPQAPSPRRLVGVAHLATGRVPEPREAGWAESAPAAAASGGERAGLARLAAWLADGGLTRYGASRDALAADAGSLLSPYLHLGCLSPAALARRISDLEGGEEFLRQLCWRDFFHQLLHARPELAEEDLRPGRRWVEDPAGLAAWKEGRTGYPLVDAGMRQLAAEGRMPNRARLVTASFLTKHLGVDWRLGAAHYLELLIDGDLAVNAGNWQWVAGTGADTRPRRFLNPTLQALRHDPSGEYVRRWVPELAGIAGPAVHEPWRLDARARRHYPPPIVEHGEARARFLGLA